MEWDAIGAIAELVGAIAVVVTLLYLSVQIRHSTKESHANSVHLFNAQLTTITERLSADGEFADIWVRGSDGTSTLSATERVRYEAALAQIFFTGSTQYYLYRSGLVPAEVYDYVEAQLRDTMKRPAVRQWWNENQHMHDTAYRAYINELIENA